MSKKVNNAFRTFLDSVVNVSKSDSDKGIASRDFLYRQIHLLSERGLIPQTYSSNDLPFGSFSRKTKIDPLDDIDIIFCFRGGDLKYSGTIWDSYKLKLENDNNNQLKALCDADSNYLGYSGAKNYYLNSNKVKNKLVSALSNIELYRKAELHARGEAVTLSLSSYDWTFDIVPAFHCENNGEEFYLIPNGKGGWKKTNPKIERNRVTKLNKVFNGKVLETIKLIKYWNKRGKMPTVTSYLLETMVLDYFDQAKHYSIDDNGNTFDYCDVHFKDALNYISHKVYESVQDSKNIQGNINDISIEYKIKLAARCRNDYQKCVQAFNAEIKENDHEKSINCWRTVFGEKFPKYE